MTAMLLNRLGGEQGGPWLTLTLVLTDRLWKWGCLGSGWVDTTHCLVPSELLRRSLESWALRGWVGWGGGGADPECGVRTGAVISKVSCVEPNVSFSTSFKKPNYQIKFGEITCCLGWFSSFGFCINLKTTNKKSVFFFHILSPSHSFTPDFSRFHCEWKKYTSMFHISISTYFYFTVKL